MQRLRIRRPVEENSDRRFIRVFGLLPSTRNLNAAASALLLTTNSGIRAMRVLPCDASRDLDVEIIEHLC